MLAYAQWQFWVSTVLQRVRRARQDGMGGQWQTARQGAVDRARGAANSASRDHFTLQSNGGDEARFNALWRRNDER